MSLTPAVNGNTGEFYALSQAEARQVLETAAKASKARRFEELRLADASADNVSVVKEALAQLGLCRADVRPPSRLLPADVKDDIRAILTAWGLA